MSKYIKLSLVTCMALSSLYGADATNVQEMFTNAAVNGQIRAGYMNNNAAEDGVKDTTATALGGQLKYETAELSGVSLGAAFYTSHSIPALSGDANQNEYNEDLASSQKHYTELAEAYVNYAYNDFNFRGGRQLIDTPLADSDDIRMTPNTFEAYVASYTLKDLGVTFSGAHVKNWQGFDAGYENVTNSRWADTGANGTWMGAATYASDALEAGLWYYDVTKAAKAVYADATGNMKMNDDVAFKLGVQYLSETETDASSIEGSIAGIMAEASLFGATAMLGYDRVSVADGKQIFQGFGGGSSYTNMQTMTAGALHDGTYGDGSSVIASLGYDLAGANIFVAYGDYKADAIGAGAKAHVSETDFGVEYAYSKAIALAIYYVIGEDKESSAETAFDDDHVQLTLNYSF